MIRCDKCGFGHKTFEELQACKSWEEMQAEKVRCQLEDHVMTREDWEAKHREHLQAADFTTQSFGYPHEDWAWLVCPCGAKHLTGTQGQEKRP